MKILSKLATICIASASLSGVAFAEGDPSFVTVNDNMQMTVNGTFSSSCSITSAPSIIEFLDMEVGVQASQDFTVSVDCNIAEASDVVELYIDPISNAVGDMGAVVFTDQGEPLNLGNVLSTFNPVPQFATTDGLQTYNFKLTAYFVSNTETLTPPTSSTGNFSSLADVVVSVNTAW